MSAKEKNLLAKEGEHDRTSRRGFFRAAGRLALLAGLGLVAWKLGRRSVAAESDGIATALCPRCPVLPLCSRPEALTARDQTGVARTEPQGQIDPASRLCVPPAKRGASEG